MTGALYIVATPIGNLADMSQRAIDILKKVDLIAAEDTRHSHYLLQHFAIATPTLSLHEHNERERGAQLLAHLRRGESIALICDAGTPLICDPGFTLTQIARDNGIKVIPIPGACAAIAALSAAGLPSDRFAFEGFLPAKKTARCRALELLKNETRTLIFYEAPHRVLATLSDMTEIFGGERSAVIARELTKLFETIKSATLAELLAWSEADDNQQKGELVILLKGQEKKISAAEENSAHILTVLLDELPASQAAALAAKITGANKNQLYKMALEIKKHAHPAL
jgi:16S rRNA (cytidine1402-2'-O)-methyltransferase